MNRLHYGTLKAPKQVNSLVEIKQVRQTSFSELFLSRIQDKRTLENNYKGQPAEVQNIASFVGQTQVKAYTFN